jgi:hypothetical protein
MVDSASSYSADFCYNYTSNCFICLVSFLGVLLFMKPDGMLTYSAYLSWLYSDLILD